MQDRMDVVKEELAGDSFSDQKVECTQDLYIVVREIEQKVMIVYKSLYH